MDRERSSPNQFGAGPNRRASTQLNIDKEGRKPLFTKPSRESLGLRDTNAQTMSGANRYGFSPTNARPPSRAGIPRPPSSASQRPPSRAAIPRPSSSASQTPSVGSNHQADVISPNSRIPRPKSTIGTIGIFAKGVVPSVADVWQLAEANEERLHPLDRSRRPSPAADASPSPAPRPFLNRQVSDEAKVRHALGKDAVDYSRPRPLSRLSNDSLRESYGARQGTSPGSQSNSSSGSFTRRLRQYEHEMEQSPSAGRQSENIFGTSRIGPKIAETGQTLARKTSNGSLNGAQSLGRRASNSSINSSHGLDRRRSYGNLSSSPRPGAFAKSHVPEGRIKQLLEQDEKGIKRLPRSDWDAAADTALPSIEAGDVATEPTPPTSRPASTNPEKRSPEKSFAFQMDADFTAGDLQISDSPRIRMGGTAFDDVSNRRLSSGSAHVDNQGTNGGDSDSPYKRGTSSGPIAPRTGRSNTKIDEIRQREQKANEQLADLRRSQSRSRNTRLEEIREKEIEAEEELAKMAQARSYYPTPDELPVREPNAENSLATSVKERPRPKNTKLDEIRAREIESMSNRARASQRLEEIREQNSMSRDLSSEDLDEEFAREPTPVGETIQSTRQPANKIGSNTTASLPTISHHKSIVSTETRPREELVENPVVRPQISHARGNSRDLLQRLAKAVGSSPVAETQVRPTSSDKVEVADEKVSATNEEQEHAHNKEIGVGSEVRPTKPTEEMRRPSLEERFKRHDAERITNRLSGVLRDQVITKDDLPKDNATHATENQGEDNVVPPKEEDLPNEPARRPYISRRRSQGRPENSEARQIADVPSYSEVRPRSVDLGRVGNPGHSLQDEPKGLDSAAKVSEHESKEEPKATEPERPSSLDSGRVTATVSAPREELKVFKPASKTEDPQVQPGAEPKATEPERPKSRRGRRPLSTDSAKDSRKSMTLSDGDPTDRIEQEMKLFAPTDNQSEKGWSRAPSAEPSTDDEDKNTADETPRPLKVDPLSMPTPKVTGAYVDTPATVRVEKIEDEDANPPTETETAAAQFTSLSRPSSSRRSSRPSSRAKSISKATDSGSETSDQKETDGMGTTTTSTVRRRTKSVNRARPPLFNSVKPPTVKDDMMELHRVHQIEDSTLDDFGDMLAKAPTPPTWQKTADQIIEDFEAVCDEETLNKKGLIYRESVLDAIRRKREVIANRPTRNEYDCETIKALDRMLERISTGLTNIRDAKNGIERLEGKVSQAGKHDEELAAHKVQEAIKKAVKEEVTKAVKGVKEVSGRNKSLGRSSSQSVETSHVHLPVPGLYRLNPLRLTFLGFILLLCSVWYGAESAMCHLYCRPTTCSTTPCVWSSTDPTWGVALPVKLDEWVTNGWGRRVAHQLSEDASDLWADAHDFITGTDIESVNINTLDFYGKRQLRRRLRKKGLAKRAAEPVEHKAKWDAWHAARLASERVEEAREMGYDISEEGESMGGDEAL